MPAYVIYARKSSEAEDRQILSIPAQIMELQKLAKSRGLVVARVFEESQSARRPGRALFNELVDLIDKQKVSGVLCWKPDRLARNMIDGGRVIDALDRDVLSEIISPAKSFRNTSDDKFMLNLEFSMSKKYVDDLSDNVRRGNRAVLQSGRVTGTVPIGYLKESPTDRLRGRGAGRTVRDPERFPLVVELFKRFLSGAYTVPELYLFARDTLGLRTRGTRRFPPGPVSIPGLYTLLRNPFYAGFLTHGGEVYQGDHEPLVTKEEFDRIQQLLRRRDAPRPKTHEFLLRGLLRCGGCGLVVVGEEHWNRRYGIRYVYYRCGRRRTPGNIRCTEPYVREGEVEREIGEALRRLSIPGTLLTWTLAQIDALSERVQATDRAAELALERARDGKHRELERLLQLCTRGILSENEYVNSRMNLLSEIERLDGELKNPGRRGSEIDARLKATLTLAAAAERVFKEGEPTERRELLGTVAERILVEQRQVKVILRRPYRLLVEAIDEYRNSVERDPNHEARDQNASKLLMKVNVPTRRIPSRRHTRKQSDPNHALVSMEIEKTAGVDAAILSWCALIDEVRKSILDSRE